MTARLKDDRTGSETLTIKSIIREGASTISYEACHSESISGVLKEYSRDALNDNTGTEGCKASEVQFRGSSNRSGIYSIRRCSVTLS